MWKGQQQMYGSNELLKPFVLSKMTPRCTKLGYINITQCFLAILETDE